MNREFVPFDDMRNAVERILEKDRVPEGVNRLYLLRNLSGRVRISVSDTLEENEEIRAALCSLAGKVGKAAGAHGYPPGETGVLFVPDRLLGTLDDSVEPVAGVERAYWAERLLVGRDWWTVGEPRPEPGPQRWTLYSIKGGVGRSATVAVLARRLAERGERALVVDLDLESPGISSAMLAPETRPALGVADWFVEELVGQGNRVIDRMTAAPEWARGTKGEVWVAPAHGADPGEYLAKLGRVYMDRRDDPWTARLRRMIESLEKARSPTVVLIESRNGLNDIAAAAVTDIDADVLMFAADSPAHWAGYDILFRHWRERNLADRMAGRLSFVSAPMPPGASRRSVERFRERARAALAGLSRAPAAAADREAAPCGGAARRDPAAIYWSPDLAAGASPGDLDENAVAEVWGAFLKSFDGLRETG